MGGAESARAFPRSRDATENAPGVFDRLDDEAQRGTDGAHVLVHDALDYGGFSGIVESEHQHAHLFVLETGFAQD